MSAKKIYIIIGAIAVALVVLCLLMMPEGIPASSIQWQGVFGSQQEDPSTAYILMASFFLAETSSDIDQVIADWLAAHPNARAVPVSVFEAEEYAANPKIESFWDFFGNAQEKAVYFVYVWVLDGDECLNLYIVRKGCCAGGTMEVQFEGPLEVSEGRYKEFLKKVNAAGEEAKKEGLGIWK